MSWLYLWVWFSLLALLVPYTKVEETFNTQASFDFLFTANLSDFHHFAFPEPVTRTCLGAAAAAAAAALPVWGLGLSGTHALLAVRVAVAALSALAFSAVHRSVAMRSKTGADFFAIFLVSSFHLPFYASRLLPNTFGLALTNLALAAFLSGRSHLSLALVAVASVLFRCDLLVVAAPVALDAWAQRGFVPAVSWGLAGGLAALALTVAVDSVFWQRRFLWPEGEVLWFNTVLNKSHLWGTLPFPWYILNALPKSLGLPAGLLVFLPWVSDGRVRKLFLVWVVAPVLSLSFLPHKELRFIFPSISAALVVLALVAADCVKKFPGRLARWVLFAMVLGNFALTGGRLLASFFNYPAGYALLAVVEGVESGVGIPRVISLAGNSGGVVQIDGPCRIHFGAYAAINGVSRFLHPTKFCTVDASQDKVDWEDVTIALAEHDKGCPLGFHEISRSAVFDSLSLSNSPPFVSVAVKPGVVVCKRL